MCLAFPDFAHRRLALLPFALCWSFPLPCRLGFFILIGCCHLCFELHPPLGDDALRRDFAVTRTRRFAHEDPLRRGSAFTWLCRNGSYTSPVTHNRCSRIASLRATATTARFLAFLPPRPASFNPHLFKSVSGPKRLRIQLRSLYQQLPQISVAFFADRQLRRTFPRFAPLRPQPHIAAHIPAALEPILVLHRQHERQSDQCPHSAYLLQEFRFRIFCPGDLL